MYLSKYIWIVVWSIYKFNELFCRIKHSLRRIQQVRNQKTTYISVFYFIIFIFFFYAVLIKAIQSRKYRKPCKLGNFIYSSTMKHQSQHKVKGFIHSEQNSTTSSYYHVFKSFYSKTNPRGQHDFPSDIFRNYVTADH